MCAFFIKINAHIYIHIYTMLKPYIKGADRCIFMHIHLQTASWYICMYIYIYIYIYIHTNLQLDEYILT